MISLDHFDILELLVIARDAGAAIMSVYERDFAVTLKEDTSPLTDADLMSHELISNRLKSWYPNIPILSEESDEKLPYQIRKGWPECWLVDPLDGTKEFIKQNGQFTVNIALVQGTRAVAGVVYAPAQRLAYYGIVGHGAFKSHDNGPARTLSPRNEVVRDRLVVAVSLSHPAPRLKTFLAEQRQCYKDVELIVMGSSLKICMVADNQADVYPRFGPTMEWDTGAAHAIAAAVGRNIVGYHTGTELIYNKENLENDWFIVR